MDDEDDLFEEQVTPPGQTRPTAADLARHRRSVPGGTPVVMDDAARSAVSRPYRRPPLDYTGDDVTSPIALFDVDRHGYSDAIAELHRQLQRVGTDPLVALAALSINFTREKERERTGQRELDKKLKAFLDVQPGGEKWGELESRVEDTDQALTVIAGRIDELGRRMDETARHDAAEATAAERSRASRRAWLIPIAAGVIGAVVAAASYVVHEINAASELRGANAVRFETMHSDVDQLKQDVRALARRKDEP